MKRAGREPVHLVDASYFVFRAYYSVGIEMTDVNDQPVNALYGFGRLLGDLLEEAKPAHIAVAFDESLSSSFRNEIFPAYKANREPAPPELKRQFALCRELRAAPRGRYSPSNSIRNRCRTCRCRCRTPRFSSTARAWKAFICAAARSRAAACAGPTATTIFAPKSWA